MAPGLIHVARERAEEEATMVVKDEDILAYRTGEQVICKECWDKDDSPAPGLKAEDMVIAQDIKDDERWFCDNCGAEIVGDK